MTMTSGAGTDKTPRAVAPHLRIVSAGALLLFILFLASCGGGQGDALKGGVDSLDFATLTRGVETLISDSGVTRYKLIAETWYIYETPESKWYFPDGIYLEQFDTLYTTEASVQADTAYYFEDKGLWRLAGNVHVMSREGQHVYSNTLYWDQNDKTVYTNDYVRIVKGEGQVLEGEHGFKSNETLTEYEIYSSRGHMDVEERPDSLSSPGISSAPVSAQRDSISVPLSSSR